MTSLVVSPETECLCNPRLKRALGVNALFSAASGMMLLLAAPSVAGLIFAQSVTLLGVGDVALLRLVGIGLIGFAAGVGWAARQDRPGALIVTGISLADFGWVMGTALLLALAAPVFSPVGTAVLAMIAVIVLVFGVLQLGALRRRH
jgi:hypothetical protein